MSYKLLFSLIFLVVSSEAIEGPCAFKNVSIMGSMTHKPVATPSNCGLATVNASEFSTKPNIILHNIDEATEKNESYTFMLLEEIPQIRDTFRLRWLVSNITPLRKSLTANETSITFMKYDRPVPDPTRPLKFFLYVYKQNKTAGLGLTGLGPRDYEHFAPQKWVSQNSRFIVGIAGGVEFLVAPNRSQPQPGYPNTHGGPVVVPVPSAPTQQHYPGQHQPQPSYPQAGYPHPQPGHPQPQPGQYTPPQPAYHPTPAGQPTVINNYYGKVKDEKKDKKKNFAVTSGPVVGLVALMASAVIMKS